MEDQKIIDLFFQRSEDALAQTKEKYGDLCGWIACNMLSSPEDAEECVNDAMLALWNTIPPERPVMLGAYAARITRNLARNRLVYNKAQKRSEAVAVSLGELEACLAGRDDVQHQVGNALAAVLVAEDVELPSKIFQIRFLLLEAFITFYQ